MPPTKHLDKLKTFYRRKRRMPSYAELAKACGFASKHAVAYWVHKWQAADILGRDAAGRLVPGVRFSSLKILGDVTAGWPSPAEEEMTDTISLDEWLIDNRESSFMLTVSGDSMIDAGIHAGDVVILNRGLTPRTGDIVVAEIDHDWTIKYFEKRGDRVRLRPANKKYKTLEPQEELRLAGVVTAVIRKYKTASLRGA